MARNAPAFDLRSELYRITGIWAQINGIDVLTAQTVGAEVGAESSAPLAAIAVTAGDF